MLHLNTFAWDDKCFMMCVYKKNNLNLKQQLQSTMPLWVTGTPLWLILNQQTEWLNGRGKGWNIIEPCTDQFTHYEYQGSFWERNIVRGNPRGQREPLESPHRKAKRPDVRDLKHNMYKRKHQGPKPLTGSNFYFFVESPLASHQKNKIRYV